MHPLVANGKAPPPLPFFPSSAEDAAGEGEKENERIKKRDGENGKKLYEAQRKELRKEEYFPFLMYVGTCGAALLWRVS